MKKRTGTTRIRHLTSLVLLAVPLASACIGQAPDPDESDPEAAESAAATGDANPEYQVFNRQDLAPVLLPGDLVVPAASPAGGAPGAAAELDALDVLEPLLAPAEIDALRERVARDPAAGVSLRIAGTLALAEGAAVRFPGALEIEAEHVVIGDGATLVAGGPVVVRAVSYTGMGALRTSCGADGSDGASGLPFGVEGHSLLALPPEDGGGSSGGGGGGSTTPACGAPGVTGASGNKGADGSNGYCSWGVGYQGSEGSPGAAGNTGGAGGNGCPVFLSVQTYYGGPIWTAGGNGGKGGNGGNGGKGGNGICCMFEEFSGRSGGHGGKSGNGGNGGNGGNVFISFCHDLSGGSYPAPSAGGSGGQGGLAGAGGPGGSPDTGCIWGNSAGSNGSNGDAGQNGAPGAPGNVYIQYNGTLCGGGNDPQLPEP